MAIELAKRYVCTECGGEYLVTRAGDGTLSCCEKTMKIKPADFMHEVCKKRKTLEGKRYSEKVDNVQILCVQVGACIPEYNGEPLKQEDLMINAISE